MPMIIDYTPEYYQSTNFTAVVGGRYAIRTSEGVGVTMTLPANPGTGAVVEAFYGYGTGSFVIAGGGATLYCNKNPYGTDFANVSSYTFDGDRHCGGVFICMFDGTSWTISVGLAAAHQVRMTDYLQMVDAEIYSDAASTANGVETKPIVFRTSDGKGIGDLRGIKDGYNVSQNEGRLLFNLNLGGWSYSSALAFQTASPPRTYCYGEMSAASVTNRSDARLKDSEEPVHPDWTSALLNLPVRAYMMGDPDLPPSEEYPQGRKNPARRLHLGFYAQDLLALAPEPQAEAAAFANSDGVLEYDLGSMLALTIHAVQTLSGELNDLKGRLANLEAGRI